VKKGRAVSSSQEYQKTTDTDGCRTTLGFEKGGTNAYGDVGPNWGGSMKRARGGYFRTIAEFASYSFWEKGQQKKRTVRGGVG